MLRDLGRRRRIDGTKVWSHDNIWDGKIAERIPVAERYEALARDDVLDFGGWALFVQVVDCGGGLGVVREEDESNVVRLEDDLSALRSRGPRDTHVPFGRKHQRQWRWSRPWGPPCCTRQG
jgi:hypothetical protein